MLKKNIGLPQYQRSFVWGERDVKRLISSMKDGQFVQPVTIALNRDSDDSGYKNLILDGQQRLSAVLLAFLRLFPKCSQSIGDDYAHEEDQEDEQGTVIAKNFTWTFSELIAQIGNCANLRDVASDCVASGNYREFDCAVDDDFFKNTYLGFSYIVPSDESKDIIHQGFTKLFRNINYFGSSLSCIESRRSLYYTQKKLLNFFEGLDKDGSDILCEIRIYEQMQPRKIDFLRYISILSEFYSLRNVNDDNDYEEKTIMKGYSSYSSRETYYADYVSFVLGLDEEVDDKKFEKFKFKSTFPETRRIERYACLKESISKLKPMMKLRKDGAFASWVDADYWLFGLVYHIVFMGKKLKNDISDLGDAIDNEVKNVRQNKLYAKSPNRLIHLRKRISESIKLIANYVG